MLILFSSYKHVCAAFRLYCHHIVFFRLANDVVGGTIFHAHGWGKRRTCMMVSAQLCACPLLYALIRDFGQWSMNDTRFSYVWKMTHIVAHGNHQRCCTG